jgi:hypothetical protein
MAEIALTDDAAFGIVLRHAVGAVPGAVLAADACIGIVDDDACARVFRIGLDGTADHAGRLQAVIAAHRKVMPLGVGVVAAFHFADTPPVDGGGIAVLLVASDNTALAPDALFHVEVEPILLSVLEGALGNQRARIGLGS